MPHRQRIHCHPIPPDRTKAHQGNNARRLVGLRLYPPAIYRRVLERILCRLMVFSVQFLTIFRGRSTSNEAPHQRNINICFPDDPASSIPKLGDLAPEPFGGRLRKRAVLGEAVKIDAQAVVQGLLLRCKALVPAGHLSQIKVVSDPPDFLEPSPLPRIKPDWKPCRFLVGNHEVQQSLPGINLNFRITGALVFKNHGLGRSRIVRNDMRVVVRA
jgi:hypothetical protein